MHRALILAAAGVAIAWSAAPTLAQDDPTVVIMNFTGPRGALARAQVLRALSGNVDFEKKKRAETVLRRKRARVTTQSGRRKLMQSMKSLDYVIWGRVRGKGKTGRTEIRIAGRTGKQLASRRASAPGTSSRNRDIREEALDLLGEVTGGSAAAASDREEPEEAYEEPTQGPTRLDDGEAPSQDVDDETPRRTLSGADPVATLMIGYGGRIRNATVNLDPSGKREYDSGLFSELLLHAHFYPGAKSDKKGLRGLYLQLDGAYAIGLSSQPQGSGDDLSTTAFRLLGQLGYLHPMDRAKVGVLVGAGWDEFDIEENDILPSARYLYARVGLVGRYAFMADDKFFGRIDAGFRYPFFLGDLQVFGRDSTGIGFDAGLTLGGRIPVGFTWAVRGGFEQYRLKFKGQASTSALAGATGKDGTDTNLLFQLLLGWSF